MSTGTTNTASTTIPMTSQAQINAVPIVVQAPANLPVPTALDLRGNLCANWKKFRRIWDNYEIASGLKHKTKELRNATLLTCIGPDALQIYDGLTFDNDDDKTDVDKVLDKFEKFCIGQTNETYERYLFNNRSQEQGETIDAYVAALRSLAKTCNYGALEESLIRDRIVMGVRENATRKKLLQDQSLTLHRCIDICRSFEKSVQHMKDITNEEVKVCGKKATDNAQPQDRPQTSSGKRNSQKHIVNCGNCGYNHVNEREQCLAWQKTCAICGMLNHFAKKCRSRPRQGQGQGQRQNQGNGRPGRRLKPKVYYVEATNESSDDYFCFTIDRKEVNTIKHERRYRPSYIP
ncbi:uncharacterized protein [Argopecten irradians]|uniref:uncharacterized protein n=1 Tax=Argopecten irradians TaxID=31199 RepID=UPI003715C542